MPKSAPFPARKPVPRWLTAAQLAAFTAAGTNAHRIFSSATAWIERFGEDWLLSFQEDIARDEALMIAPEWQKEHNLFPRRIFGKFIPRQNQDRISPTLLEGDSSLSLETVVEEAGLRYGLDFAAGYSAGLFIDQRANRAFLRQSAPKRVLNTFAYTCSFSVVAAQAGAETVSIDLSKKSLDRGRANFALNNLDTTNHRFLADDVMEVLPRLARRNEKFDAIILDPPTFSRGNKGRRFQVEQDFEELLLAALEIASPRARILLSTNCTKLTKRNLEAIARFALKSNRLAGDFHYEPALTDIPPDTGAQTMWLVLR